MQRFVVLGIAAGAIAFAPASFAQSTLGQQYDTLQQLMSSLNEACEEPGVSEDGQRRCQETRWALNELRGRWAQINTKQAIAGWEDNAPPSAAEIAALTTDLQAYASQLPVALQDLDYQPPEENGEDGAGDATDAAAEGEGDGGDGQSEEP